MKFNLEIRNIQGSKRIILRFLCTYPRSFGHVDAIMDTGAPITILSANDALRLKMPFNNLSGTKPIKGFGRGGTPALSLQNFQLTLHSTENERKNLKFPIVLVDVPTLRKFGEEALSNALTIPTLMGLDFLETNNLKLFINIKNNTAYLED